MTRNICVMSQRHLMAMTRHRCEYRRTKIQINLGLVSEILVSEQQARVRWSRTDGKHEAVEFIVGSSSR